jgi:serine/threonine protein kinase
MAVVFRAKHKMLGSPVAIKVLRADLMHKRDVVERFRTEALAASHLRHENVIQVHDFGSQKGIGVYMVLEFLEGMDLEQKLEESPLPLPWVMAVTKQICSGLEAAHNAKIIHRDLKPSNIYLVPRKDHDIPAAKILDFGIAKIQESQLFEGQQNLTRTGTVLGTPYYLSPEQLRRRDKQELGPSVDIYAIGVIIYQLLTGHLPIEEPTLAEQMAAILTKTPRAIGELRPDLAGTSMEHLLHRLLAKNPEDRPQTIGEVWEELEKAAGAFNDPAIDAALRQQWSQTYKAPELSEIQSEPSASWFQRHGITAVLVSLLLIGGSTLGYIFLQPKQTTIAKKQRRAPIPAATPKWLKLKNQGAKAYKSGNYLDALKYWRKSLARLKKKRTNTNPTSIKKQRQAILLDMGLASQSANRNYAALQFYQQLASSSNQTKEQKQLLQQRITDLRSGVTKARQTLDFLSKGLLNDLKSKNYKIAFKTYNELLKFPDKSLPDPYIKAAASIEKLLPSVSLKLYKKGRQLTINKKEQAKVDSQLAPVNNRVVATRQAMKLLMQNAKRSGRVRKSLTRLLNQQAGDVVLHKTITTRITQLIPTKPALASWLLNTYTSIYRRLTKQPKWLWVKQLEGKTLPSVKQLNETNRLLKKQRRLLSTSQRKQKRAISLSKRGRMTKALDAQSEHHTARQTFWKQLASTPGPLQQNAKDKLKQLTKQASAHSNIKAMWAKIKTQHELDQLKQADKDFKTLQDTTKTSPLHDGFNQTHKKWLERHQQAATQLQKGEQAAQKKQWNACKYRFDRYLRMYPKSWQKDAVKLKRCKCRCKLPAPFEPCSEQCKLPYK